LKRAIVEAVAEEKYWLADQFEKQLRTLKKRRLLGKLGTYGLMPKYGFPTEVVELKIRSSSKEAEKVELARDLKLALSEFAPGNQVVANKKVWTSRGIVLPSRERDLHLFRYWHCAACQYFSAEQVVSTQQTGSGEPGDRTCHCEKPIDAKQYLYPEFGFTTESKQGKDVGDTRPPYKSYSSVFYHEDGNGGNFEPLKSLRQIECRESRHGWIHVINNNRNQEFWVCMACGYAFNSNPFYEKEIDKTHQRPWQGRGSDKCQGKLKGISLGYRYRTDVLELKIPRGILKGIELKDQNEIKAMWLSALYALVNGACDHLEINERDLGGCLYYYKGSDPLIVLFDTAPGGAGFVKEVKENFKGVIDAAIKKVRHSCCAEDSSCISCLRTYFNQRDHNVLQRGLAQKFLNKINDFPLH